MQCVFEQLFEFKFFYIRFYSLQRANIQVLEVILKVGMVLTPKLEADFHRNSRKEDTHRRNKAVFHPKAKLAVTQVVLAAMVDIQQQAVRTKSVT